MGTSYKAKIDIRCWKEHTCVGCGGTFAYVLARTVTGQGESEQAATVAAEAEAAKTIESDINQEPCPTCGLYQPDMVGERKATSYMLLFLLSLVVMAASLILYLTDVLPADTAAWISGGVAIAVTLASVRVHLGNPNRDPAANQSRAQDRIATNQLRQVQPGQVLMPGQPGWQPRPSVAATAALAMLGLAALGMPAAEWTRIASGTPSNAGWYPPVAGPGDETYLYLPDSISSIKGMWSGSATVTAQAAGDNAAPITLGATTKSDGWGNTISAKSSEKNSSSSLWVRMKIPNDPNLAGKTLDCKIALDVRFPAVQIDNSFADVQKHFTHDARLTLAAPGAGRQYTTLLYAGMSGGGMLVLSTCLVLMARAKVLGRQANPTRVYPCE
jgi:hypothetical protein